MSDEKPPLDLPTTDSSIKPGLPSSLAPAPNPSESVAYQPVSGWAVAGLVLSGLYALLVLASTVVALFQGASFFFPIWLQGLAVGGIVFSWVGQNEVRNSEGTRTGARLASIGIWLGVVSALCYLSYYFATGYALQAQANNFLMTEGADTGFFPLLRKGGVKPAPVNAAFLLTRPVTARSGNPDDPKSMSLNNDTPGKEGGKGELSQFKESPMARLLFQKPLPEDAEITPLSVQKWSYDNKSYKIIRNYSIKTKEGELEMEIIVASIEGEASGQGRKWFLNFRESSPVKLTLSRFGEGIKDLRGRAREWFENEWLGQLDEGKPFHALKNMDQTPWKDLQLQEQKPEDLRASVYRFFESPLKGRKQHFNVQTRKEDVGFWDMVDGKIRIRLYFRLTMLKDEIPPVPARHFEGFATLETRQAIDPATFDRKSPAPDWALIGLTFTHAYPASRGGMGPD